MRQATLGVELVEQHERADVGDQGAEPVRAVDHDVDAAAVLRGDQLVDRRVDRGVLAADAHAVKKGMLQQNW
jgi:hypothetical protein